MTNQSTYLLVGVGARVKGVLARVFWRWLSIYWSNLIVHCHLIRCHPIIISSYSISAFHHLLFVNGCEQKCHSIMALIHSTQDRSVVSWTLSFQVPPPSLALDFLFTERPTCSHRQYLFTKLSNILMSFLSLTYPSASISLTVTKHFQWDYCRMYQVLELSVLWWFRRRVGAEKSISNFLVIY